MSVRVLEAGGGGPRWGAPAAALSALREPSTQCTWVHASPSEEVFAALEAFGLSEVTIRSLRGGSPERPRVEEYADYAYVSLFAAPAGTVAGKGSPDAACLVDGTLPSDAETDVGSCIPLLQDIWALLGRSWLITIGEVSEEDYSTLCEHMEWQVFSRNRGASFLLFFFLDWAISTLYPVLDDLGDRIDGLEDLVVSEEGTVSMQTLFRLKRDLVELRRRAAPLRDVMQRIDSLQVSLVEGAVEVYFRDLHDDILRTIELIDTYRDILSSALDLHLSTVNNRLGEIMKRLTVVATVFMPLTFITGFFGMNFERLPFSGVSWFIVTIVVMAAVPAIMLAYFRRKEWW